MSFEPKLVNKQLSSVDAAMCPSGQQRDKNGRKYLVCLQTSSFLGCPENDKEGHGLETRSLSSHTKPGEPTTKLWGQNITSQVQMNNFLCTALLWKYFSKYIFLSQKILDMPYQERFFFFNFSVGINFYGWKLLRKEFILQIPAPSTVSPQTVSDPQGTHHSGNQMLECDLIISAPSPWSPCEIRSPLCIKAFLWEAYQGAGYSQCCPAGFSEVPRSCPLHTETVPTNFMSIFWILILNLLLLLSFFFFFFFNPYQENHH